MTTTALTPNVLESIRQAASELGDCDTTRLCNAALYGTTTKERTAAKRKLARQVAR